ncbi:hypothetical protein [Thioclava electrotropha]|uniref:Glycosyltransferase n=1 Tax=Thioclava electrotropha TaxID=1549850 RepID=A0ABX6Z063_9RHOB|nr:hypothetical protein [Thioclava electrotropha]QPZ92878.1 hypothetical protein AKL02_019560 [Thioclava electrotropha]
MTDDRKIEVHAIIIAWSGWIEAAQSICAAIEPVVDNLSTIWSDAQPEDQTGPGEWIRVPNEQFFGPKLSKGLDVASGQHVLLIHADTKCDDWARLVRRCKAAFVSYPEIGVWAPAIENTFWAPEVVALSRLPGKLGLHTAAHTDGIIVAFSPEIVQRLSELGPENNNLGWGVDHAAVAYTRCKGKLVVYDPDVSVWHNPSTGYNGKEAEWQMQSFLTQLSATERDQISLLQGYVRDRRRKLKRKRSNFRSLLKRLSLS